MTRSPTSRSRKSAGPRAIMGRVRASYPRILLLLVPLDFTGKSRQALRYAIPIAQKFSSRIALLHIIPRERKRSADSPPTSDEARAKRDALRRLEEMTSKLVPPSARGPITVGFGTPADEILATAKKLDVDMIILATHGLSGLKRVWKGSTAEQVMRRAVCPVLSLRRH